jgi:tryptophanyl-tRNA synthetase
LEDDEKL